MFAPVIQAAVHHQAIQPRIEIRFPAELPDAVHQLQERILRDIVPAADPETSKATGAPAPTVHSSTSV